MSSEPGFWDRLGLDEAGMPIHLPMGVDPDGNGPEDDDRARRWVCWCGDDNCPLTVALDRALATGVDIGYGP